MESSNPYRRTIEVRHKGGKVVKVHIEHSGPAPAPMPQAEREELEWKMTRFAEEYEEAEMGSNRPQPDEKHFDDFVRDLQSNLESIKSDGEEAVVIDDINQIISNLSGRMDNVTINVDSQESRGLTDTATHTTGRVSKVSKKYSASVEPYHKRYWFKKQSPQYYAAMEERRRAEELENERLARAFYGPSWDDVSRDGPG